MWERKTVMREWNKDEKDDGRNKDEKDGKDDVGNKDGKDDEM